LKRYIWIIASLFSTKDIWKYAWLTRRSHDVWVSDFDALWYRPLSKINGYLSRHL